MQIITRSVDLAKALDGKRNGAGFMAHCVVHEDSTPSLSISDGAKGVVLKCHAGCSQAAVLAALRARGISLSEPKAESGEALRITRAYNYLNESGAVLFQAVRGERAGKKTFFQRRPDGNRGWINNIEGVRKVPYRLDEIRQAIENRLPIWIVEGEKDADNLAGGFHLPATTNAGGAGKWTADHTSCLAGAVEAIVIPDNDSPGAAHALKVAESLQSAGIKCKILNLPGLPPKGDVSDFIATGGTRDQLLALAAAAQYFDPAAVAPAAPAPPAESANGKYHVNADGVYTVTDEGLAKVSSVVKIVGDGADADSLRWSRLFEVHDPDGRIHRFVVPRSAFAGSTQDLLRDFLDRGAQILHRTKFRAYIEEAPVNSRFALADRTGWHGNTFLLPDGGEIKGSENSRPVFLNFDSVLRRIVRADGSLEDWKREVANHCKGNSRLILALCASLAPPLIEPLGLESGGLHFRGPSSCGKSTALRVAASVWGSPKFVRTWRSTDNGLEGTAAATSGLPLLLDELAQVEPKIVGEAVYMLANQQGKARASQTGAARHTKDWKLLFLSTGEIALSDHLRSAGKRVTAGQETRILDIPADVNAGSESAPSLFENTGMLPGDEFSRLLVSNSAKFYGGAGPEFVRGICKKLDSLPGEWAQFHAEFSAVIPSNACGQVVRAADRFALLAFAGALATEFEILPFTADEVVNAIERVFRDWLEARGGAGAGEDRAVVDRVREFLAANGESKFVRIEGEGLRVDDRQTVNDRAGWRKKRIEGRTEALEFLITPTAFAAMVSPARPKDAAAALLKLGYVRQGADGRNNVTERVPDHAKPIRVYAISASILEGRDEEEEEKEEGRFLTAARFTESAVS